MEQVSQKIRAAFEGRGWPEEAPDAGAMLLEAADKIEQLEWLIANGEKHFGTLWREATAADIDAVRSAHSAGEKP